MSLKSKWKPLAPKPPELEPNGASTGGGGSSREEMLHHKCLVCSKQVRAPRNMVMVHCADCDGRLSTYKNVISSVEKVRTAESPPKVVVTTGLGLNPNLYRKASELRFGNAGATGHIDGLGFGEMDWNSVGLINRPLLSESLLDEDLTPRHVSRLETAIETPTAGKPSPAMASAPVGVSVKTSTNVKGSLANPKKIIVIKNATGVQDILEESATGQYVKCSDPLKLKKCIEASGTGNGVKVRVGLGQQRVPSGEKNAKSFTVKMSPQASHRPRLIAPKPPPSALPASPTRIVIPPGISLVPQSPVSAASPSRFVLPMPVTASQVFQQTPPIPQARVRSTSSKAITEACGSMSCPVCQKSFWKRTALNDHIAATHKNSRAFPCSHCNVSFSLLINLVNHKLQMHPHLMQYLCRSCGLETHDWNIFNKHISPNFVATFDCSCGEQFKTAALLQAHQKLTNHLSRNASQQAVKAKATTTLPPSPRTAEVDTQKKLIPERDLGQVPNGSIKCPTCMKPVYFAHAKYLDLHIELRHSGEKVLPCQFCQLKFSHLLDLVSHKTNTHPKLSKWTCKLCGASFSHLNESEYCSHLNTHSIVTNDCRCGKQFATEDELEEHGRTAHPDVARFKCFEKRIQEFPSRSPEPTSRHEAVVESSKSTASQQVAKVTETPKPKTAAPANAAKITSASPPLPTRGPAVKGSPSRSPQKDAKKPAPRASATRSPGVVKTYGNRQLPTKAPSETNEIEVQEKEKRATVGKEKSSSPKAAVTPRQRSLQSPRIAESKPPAMPGRRNGNKAKAVTVPEEQQSPKKAKVATSPSRKRAAEPTETPASPAKKARSQRSQSPVKSASKQSPRAAAAAADSGIRRSGRERKPKKME